MEEKLKKDQERIEEEQKKLKKEEEKGNGSSLKEKRGFMKILKRFGHTNDYNLINNVLGTRVATKLSGSASTYWMASRYYSYSSASNYYWSGRRVSASGSYGGDFLYGFSSSRFDTFRRSNALRPIVTLSSSLSWSGVGNKDYPMVMQ